jgi:hypothetical protein
VIIVCRPTSACCILVPVAQPGTNNHTDFYAQIAVRKMREAGLTVLKGSGSKGSSSQVLGNGDVLEVWGSNMSASGQAR